MEKSRRNKQGIVIICRSNKLQVNVTEYTANASVVAPHSQMTRIGKDRLINFLHEAFDKKLPEKRVRRVEYSLALGQQHRMLS